MKRLKRELAEVRTEHEKDVVNKQTTEHAEAAKEVVDGEILLMIKGFDKQMT